MNPGQLEMDEDKPSSQKVLNVSLAPCFSGIPPVNDRS